MSISETISPFLGRVILAWFFISEAWWRIRDWDRVLPSRVALSMVALAAVAGFAMRGGWLPH